MICGCGLLAMFGGYLVVDCSLLAVFVLLGGCLFVCYLCLFV